MKSSGAQRTEIGYEEWREALRETIRESSRPAIKKGYKSAREIAKESNQNYNTVRQQLMLARDKGLVQTEKHLANGHWTAYYKLK